MAEKTYSKSKTIKDFNDALRSPGTLYKARCVNWSGKCKEGEYYSEIISEKLLEDIGNFNIVKIARESYFQNHSGEIKAFTNRGEEILAKSLLNKKIEGIGEIFDYQIPLKKSQKDTGVGKIDLVSIDGDKLRLIEIKAEDAIDTLLRCVLEAYTYSKQLDSDRFKSEYTEKKEIAFGNEEPIPTVLIPETCKAAKEFRNNEHPKVIELAKKLKVNIKIFEIKKYELSTDIKILANS